MTNSIGKIDPQVMADARMALMMLLAQHDETAVFAALRAAIAERDLPTVRTVNQRINLDYFDQAWAMWPEKGRRRSRKTHAMGEWTKVASKIGGEVLLNAVNAYVLSDDALKMDGEYVPALDRWIKHGKYEVWMEAEAPRRVGFV
jgi:hypothetical protein